METPGAFRFRYPGFIVAAMSEAKSPLENAADRVDAVNAWTGRVAAYCAPAMAATATGTVIGRHNFGWAAPWALDLLIWGTAIMALLGSGYALLRDAHVRIDPLYRAADRRTRAAIDIFGVLLLTLPSLAMIAWHAIPYVAASWRIGEGATQAGGLPGVFMLKSALLAFCVLTAAQALALAIRRIAR